MDNSQHAGASRLERHPPVSRAQIQITENRMANNPTTAAILPAYNEGGRIGLLLAVLREVKLIQEIIVVDDGSLDATAEEARQAASLDRRVRVVRHEQNQGKGAAMFTGCRHTRATIVLFLDCDLIGLTPNQVEDLIQPVAEGRADMTIGLFQHGSFLTDLSQRVTPWLSGQRCLWRRLMWQVSTRAAAGYGVETAITIAARQGQWRIASVPLAGVSHPTGEVHRGLVKGAANRMRMYANILQAAWLASLPHAQFDHWNARIRLASILMTLVFAIALAYNQAQALAPIRLEDLISINVEGIVRVLVIDQDTNRIPDLLTVASDSPKPLDLSGLDFSQLKLPLLDLPILDELPERLQSPELIQGVVLSLDKVDLNAPKNQLKIRLAGDPDPDASYHLILVTSSGAIRKYPLIPRAAGKGQKAGAAIIDLAEFEDPFLLGLALEAEIDADTQLSKWTLILIPEWVP